MFPLFLPQWFSCLVGVEVFDVGLIFVVSEGWVRGVGFGWPPLVRLLDGVLRSGCLLGMSGVVRCCSQRSVFFLRYFPDLHGEVCRPSFQLVD